MAARTKTRQEISELEIPNTTDGQGKPTRTKLEKEKADVLSDTFSGVFTKEDSGDIPTLPKQNFTETLDDVIISEEGIRKKLRTLNPGKSPGPDLVHPRVLKELAEALAPPLHIIFKTLMDTGIVPAIWREANVTAIFKNKGNCWQAGNYRPVSLTSVVCKVMESFVRDSMMQHLEQNDLLSNQQCGFISGRPTGLQLLNVMDEWTSVLAGEH